MSPWLLALSCQVSRPRVLRAWRPAVPASPWQRSHRKEPHGDPVPAVCLGGSLGPGVAGNSDLSPQSCWEEGPEGRGTFLRAIVLCPVLGGGCREFLISALGPGSLRFPVLFSKEAGLRGAGGRPLMTFIPRVAGKGLGKVTGPACQAGWPSQLTFLAKVLLFPESAVSHSSAEATGRGGCPASRAFFPPCTWGPGLEKE